jgi:flagellar motor switch protein FliG
MSAADQTSRSPNQTADASADAEGGPGDFATWPKFQKVAGLLLIVSPDNAAEVLKGLTEQELEAVTTEMAKFTVIPQDLQCRILDEFSGVAVQAASAVTCGLERVQGLLEKSVGLRRASDLIHRVSPSGAPVAAMQPIVEMEARQIFALLRDEQIQMVALVASHLPPEKSSEVLSMFRPEVCEQIIERLATMAPTTNEVLESVVETLQQKLGKNRATAVSHTGGVRMAAQMLNALPRSACDAVLLVLKERNAELGEAVRRSMFTFEELHRLDPKTLQRVLQAVDTSTLTTALKTASDKVKTKLLSCISKRAAENVREELELMGTVKLRDIEAAQLAIISTVRQLESDGIIDLEELRPNANH